MGDGNSSSESERNGYKKSDKIGSLVDQIKHGIKEKQLTPEELYDDLSASVTKFYQELKFLVFQSVRPKTC